MYRLFGFSALVTICLFALLACSGTNPVEPSGNTDLSGAGQTSASESQTQLWGWFDCTVDLENITVEVVPARLAEFTANVTNFLNSKPLSLKFDIKGTPMGTDYIDIDIDVSITHPFPGLPQYHGYDVRGIFMGDGSASLMSNPDLVYPVHGIDQRMMAALGSFTKGPDGYTRWFNFTEFNQGGMPMFSYTPGNFASPGYGPTATLNAYKYFADSIGPNDDVFSWLNDHADLNGVFSSGATNERTYYIRFPNIKGIKFGYAVIANWGGEDVHPSNAPEAVVSNVIDSSDIFYMDPGSFGGDLVLDFSLFGWDTLPSSLTIESTVLSAPYILNATEMVPVMGTENYSTWHIDVPADNVTGVDNNEYWIIAEYDGLDYSNDFGTPNLAGDDPLTAYFRYDLFVSGEPGNLFPVCDIEVVTPMPAEAWGIVEVEFDASGSYDPEGDTLVYEWDFNNDTIFGDPYDSGTDENPTKIFAFENHDQVCVRVTDTQNQASECCADVDIGPYSAKNIELRTGVVAKDLAVDPNDGNLLILYEDGEVWEYTEDGFYVQANASYLFDAIVPVTPYNPTERIANHRIDIAPSGNMIVSAYVATGGWPAGSFSPAGVKLDDAPAPGAGDSVPDVYTYPAGGTYSNDHMFLCPGNGGSQNNMYRNVHTGWWWAQIYQTAGENGLGYDKVQFNNVVGAVGSSGNQFWVIEDTPDYYASRWLHTGSSYGYHNFDNAWFGTGSQTDDDEGWYEAKDLTMDSSGYFYVLDELSTGVGRIKVFESGAPGNALPTHAAGDVTSISDPPLRIEGSSFVSTTYGNLIFVLHGSATAPSKLSVFFPSEFNW